MTEQEQKVLDLAIQWRRAKFAVEEALIKQEFMHAVDMLIKERRDAAAQGPQGCEEEGETEGGE